MIKKILIALAVIIVALILAGFLLPSSTVIRQSVAIGAPAGYVFEEINELKNWPRWSYWNSVDPEMKMEYSNPSFGTGSSYTWDGPHTGKGKLTVTAARDEESVTTEVAFSDSGAGVATYALEPGKDGVTLTSTFTYDHGLNVLSRWMGVVFIKSEVGKAMEYEANKLKELAEAKPRFSVSIEQVEVPAVSYVGIAHTMAVNDQQAIEQQTSKLFTELLWELCRKQRWKLPVIRSASTQGLMIKRWT
jgi:hypothetical protein